MFKLRLELMDVMVACLLATEQLCFKLFSCRNLLRRVIYETMFRVALDSNNLSQLILAVISLDQSHWWSLTLDLRLSCKKLGF